MKTLEQLVKENAEFAAHTFKLTGELVPMWIAECEDGSVLPIMVPMTDKAMVIRAIRAIFKEKRVKRYVFMTEAWTLVAKDRTPKEAEEMQRYAENHSLANHPDRREIIMVTGEDRENSIMGQMFILRPEHGKPTVSPFEILTMGKLEGRMTGLLPKEA